MRFMIPVLAVFPVFALAAPGCSTGIVDDPTGQVAATVDATSPFERKVMLLVVDPVLSSQGGQRLTQYKRWDSPTPAARAQQLVDWLRTASRGRVNYKVVESNTSDALPPKVGGFMYDEATYLAVLDGRAQHHEPDWADYMPLVTAFDVCGKANRGDIDEVWMFGGPWMGFYESRLAGPGAFDMNGAVLLGTTCRRIVPFMGFSYEVGLANMVHDFGHRTERTMMHLYGSWDEDSVGHAWDRFGLDVAESPGIGLSGCGRIHRPPNSGAAEGIYDSADVARSFCDDFLHYPNLRAPADAAVPITCSAWGCSELGYYAYWFAHLPHFSGMGPDGKANDWWPYIADSSTATTAAPPAGCRTFDGDERTCSARAGCAFYQCSQACYPRGTSNNLACGAPPPPSPPNPQPSPSPTPPAPPSPPPPPPPPVRCRAHDGNVGGCDAQSGCAYYACSSQCWPTGTPNATACPPACRANDGNLAACDAQTGCAFYLCSNTCWPNGTPNGVACP